MTLGNLLFLGVQAKNPFLYVRSCSPCGSYVISTMLSLCEAWHECSREHAAREHVNMHGILASPDATRRANI